MRTPSERFAGLRRVHPLIVFAAAVLIARPGPAEAQAIATIDDLRWFTGSWQMVEGERTTEEHWTEAASNAILAVGRTVVAGRLVFFEYLRIEARPDGLFYVAQPRGGPPTDFKLTSWDGRTAVFENPQHDFPKRISYTHVSADSVTARVDGGAGVERGAVTYPYSRVRR